MKLISWNVNGLRACVQKGFLDFFHSADADFFCLQETKLQEGQITLDLPGYHQYWCCAEKKGYSGTAIFTKHTPLSVSYGLGVAELDTEGRLITLEYPEFYLVTCYTPNAQRGLARIDHRMRWDEAFRNYIAALDTKKPVILCGDLNVAHQEIDLKNPASNRGSAGFSDEERESFSKTLALGFTDTFRHLNPDATGAYTWWSYMFHARENNAGWRIDYFLVSDRVKDSVYKTPIYSDIFGSDHCPVGLEIDMLCNGGICWPTDSQSATAPANSKGPDSKSSGVKAAAVVISAAMLVTLCLLFPTLRPDTQDLPSDPSATTVTQVPEVHLLNCTVFEDKLYYVFKLPSITASSFRIFEFFNETATYRVDNVPMPQDLPVTGMNFWIHVEPADPDLLRKCSLTATISEPFTESVFAPTLYTTNTYTEDNRINGWMIYGYIPTDQYVSIELTDSKGSVMEYHLLRVSPVFTEADAHRMSTDLLLDHVLHMDAMDYSSTDLEAGLERYVSLCSKYPTMHELLQRFDLTPVINTHTQNYPQCTQAAEYLYAIVEAHRQKVAAYGTYLSYNEATSLPTKQLIYSLLNSEDFARYLAEMRSAGKTDAEIYTYAETFVPALSIMKGRDDAIPQLELYSHLEVAAFLLSRLEYSVPTIKP